MAVIAVGLALAAFSQATFPLFIMEEAVQSSGFAVSILIREKIWRQANGALQNYKNTINHLKEMIVIYNTIFLAPQKVTDFVSQYQTFDNTEKDNLLTLITNHIIGAYSQFADAAWHQALAYESIIAQHWESVNNGFFTSSTNLKKTHALEKKQLDSLQKERIENLHLEKRQALDELNADVKQQSIAIARALRAKTITREQSEDQKAALSVAKDEDERAITAFYNERERALKEIEVTEDFLLERTQENERDELRTQEYPVYEINLFTPPPLPGETPPTGSPLVPTPQNLRIDIAGSDFINIKWDNIPDLSNFRSYKVYKNNNFVAETILPDFIEMNLPSLTTFNYQVSAVDNDNNESFRTAPLSVSTSAPLGGGGPPPPAQNVPVKFIFVTEGGIPVSNVSVTMSLILKQSDQLGLAEFTAPQNSSQQVDISVPTGFLLLPDNTTTRNFNLNIGSGYENIFTLKSTPAPTITKYSNLYGSNYTNNGLSGVDWTIFSVNDFPGQRDTNFSEMQRAFPSYQYLQLDFSMPSNANFRLLTNLERLNDSRARGNSNIMIIFY